MKNLNLKKIAAAVLIFAVLLMTAACAAGQKAAEDTASELQTTQEAAAPDDSQPADETLGQEPEQQDAEQSEDSDNTPDGGQRTGLLAKPALWLLLALGILLLLLAGILIRHHVILKNRRRAFDNPDNSGAASSLFADAAGLLSALGLERGGGSMLALCGPVSERFGEETADTFRAMAALNEKALFSSRTLDAAERESMRNFHGTVLNLLKTNTKWPRKLRLKWLNCLY